MARALSSNADAGTRVVLALPAVTCVTATLLGWSVVATAALLMAVIVPLRRHPRVWLAEAPTAGVLLTAAVMVVCEVAPLLHLRPLGSVMSARTTLVVLAVMVAAWGQLRPLGGDGLPLHHVSVLVRVPAVVMLMTGMLLWLLPLGRTAGWFLRNDNLRHLMFVVEGHASGVLEYTSQPYPRAWHSLVALVWTASTSSSGSAGLGSLVHVASLSYWALYALVVVACGVFAAELGERTGLERPWPVRAGLLAGSLMLWPQFVSHLPLGFQTSVLATLVVLVCLTELFRHPDGARAWLVAAAGTMVVAHTWQLVLPVPVLMLLVATWRRLRSDRPAPWAIALGSVAVVVLSWPAVLAVYKDVGLAHARTWGYFPAGAAVTGTLVICSAAPLVWRLRSNGRVQVLTAVVGGLLVEWVLVSVVAHSSLGAYYPMKLFWLATTCAAPVAVIAACRLARARTVGAASGRMRPLVAGPLGALVLTCLAAPFGAPTGLWSSGGDASKVLSTAETPEAGAAQVVWLVGDPVDSTTTRIVLDYYRAGTTLDRTEQDMLTTEGECRLLQNAVAPTVLSDASVEDVRERYDCVPAVRVIRATR